MEATGYKSTIEYEANLKNGVWRIRAYVKKSTEINGKWEFTDAVAFAEDRDFFVALSDALIKVERSVSEL